MRQGGKANSVGRPSKYRKFIEILEDDTLYTAASIVNNGLKNGMINFSDDEELRRRRLRIRHTLVRFTKNHRFPEEGDGWVKLPGQARTMGWFGRRWKAALR